MRNRRPISQATLHAPPSPQWQRDAAEAMSGLAHVLQYIGPVIGRNVAIVAHSLHKRPCYCLQPRTVARQLRRRDRKRARYT